LHSPLAFEQVDLEVIVFESFKNVIQTVQMILPTIAEHSNIINVNLTHVQTTKYFFNDFLSEVWRIFDADGQTFVFVFPIGSYDEAELETFLVEFICVVTHCEVDHCEELVVRISLQNVLDLR
jgi:hypothetical protein